VRHEKLTAPVSLDEAPLDESASESSDALQSSVGSQSSQSSLRSQTSSVSGHSTIKSQRSAAQRAEKNAARRARTEKKRKASGRRGSPKEQEFLLGELRAQVPERTLQAEVHALLLVLVALGQAADAAALQALFAALCDAVQRALPLMNTPLV